MASVQAFLTQLAAFLPRLLAAVVILVIGWLLAKFSTLSLFVGLLVSFNVVTEGAGIDGFKKGGKKSAIDAGRAGLLAGYPLTLLVAFDSLRERKYR